LDRFNESRSHQNFIKLAKELDHIDWAKERYQHLRAVIGDDPEIDRRLQQLLFLDVERQQVPEPSSNFELTPQRLSRWHRQLIGYLLGGILFLVGLLHPDWRSFLFLGAFLIAWILLYGVEK
jgi:hypothetical protein